MTRDELEVFMWHIRRTVPPDHRLVLWALAGRCADPGRVQRGADPHSREVTVSRSDLIWLTRIGEPRMTAVLAELADEHGIEVRGGADDRFVLPVLAPPHACCRCPSCGRALAGWRRPRLPDPPGGETRATGA